MSNRIVTREKIYNALSTKPKDPKELSEETGVPWVYRQLRELVAAGRAAKTVEGKFLVVKKTKASAAKKSKKFATREEANAARNERRRKARAAAKNAGENVTSESPAVETAVVS